MALIARLKLKDEFTLTQYFLYIDSLLSWFDDSFLELSLMWSVYFLSTYNNNNNKDDFLSAPTRRELKALYNSTA